MLYKKDILNVYTVFIYIYWYWNNVYMCMIDRCLYIYIYMHAKKYHIEI